MIPSYTSDQRLLLRGGVAVAVQSLQSILDFAENLKLKSTTGLNEGFCVKCTVDIDRVEPFFAIILSTQTLMGKFDSSKPIETDETFKITHEGYA